MKRLYNVFRVLGYACGLAGVILLVPLKNAFAQAERLGLLLLAAMFCSFLFSYALFVAIKTGLAKRRDD